MHSVRNIDTKINRSLPPGLGSCWIGCLLIWCHHVRCARSFGSTTNRTSSWYGWISISNPRTRPCFEASHHLQTWKLHDHHMERALCLQGLKVCGTSDFLPTSDAEERERWWDSAHNKEVEEKVQRRSLGVHPHNPEFELKGELWVNSRGHLCASLKQRRLRWPGVIGTRIRVRWNHNMYIKGWGWRRHCN